MGRWRAAAGCFLLLIAASNVRSTPAPWVVQFDANSPPTMYRSNEGLAEGLYPALVREAFQRMQRPVEVRAVPFKRLMRDLQSGRSAAGGVVWTSGRDTFAAFSAPYFVEHIEVFSRPGGAPRFTRLDDLRGRRVGVVRGWSYGDGLDKRSTAADWQVEEVDSDIQNLSKLASGRLEYALVNRLAADMLIRDPRFAMLVRGQAPAVEIGIHLALPRGRADEALLREFDDHMAAMQTDGTVARLEAEARRDLNDARASAR